MDLLSVANKVLILRPSYQKRVSRTWPMNLGNDVMDDVLDRITDREMFFGEGFKMFIHNYHVKREMKSLGAKIVDVHEIYERVQKWLWKYPETTLPISEEIRRRFHDKGEKHVSECIFSVMLQIYAFRQDVDIPTKNMIGECLCIALKYEEYHSKNIETVFEREASPAISANFKTALYALVQNQGKNYSTLDQRAAQENYWVVYNIFEEIVSGTLSSYGIKLPDKAQGQTSRESIFLLKLFESEVKKSEWDPNKPESKELTLLLDLIKRAATYGWCVDYRDMFASVNSQWIGTGLEAFEKDILDFKEKHGTIADQYTPKVVEKLNAIQKSIIRASLKNIGDEIASYVMNAPRLVRAVAPYILTLILKNELERLSNMYGPKQSAGLMSHVIHGSTPLLYLLSFELENKVINMGSSFVQKALNTPNN